MKLLVEVLYVHGDHPPETERSMKYLGEKTMPDPRAGQPAPFDLFEFESAS